MGLNQESSLPTGQVPDILKQVEPKPVAIASDIYEKLSFAEGCETPTSLPGSFVIFLSPSKYIKGSGDEIDRALNFQP